MPALALQPKLPPIQQAAPLQATPPEQIQPALPILQVAFQHVAALVPPAVASFGVVAGGGDQFGQ